jgi:arylsulfatase
MSISRRIGSLLVSAVGLVAVSLPAVAQVPASKPNIVFIMGDDIGWMQPSIYHRGLMVGETPNIDRIGNEGAIFMTYYAESRAAQPGATPSSPACIRCAPAWSRRNCLAVRPT